WAVMVSLAAVWRAAGVEPDAVVGHSQGEIAAAAVAGILSLEDAAKVVALRSRTLAALAGHGGMLSIAEPVDAVRRRIAAFGDRLSIAAVNGPSATVVSGEPGALRELQASCGDAVRTRMIPVDYASHGPQVERLRDEILAVLGGITPTAAEIPMVSALTGDWLAGPELDAGYWYSSLRETVEFDRAIGVLSDSGHGVFVECSPHPVLIQAVDAAVTVGTLRRDDGGARRLMASFAEAFVNGVAVDWSMVLGGGRTVCLPTYAFQRRFFWPSAQEPAGMRGAPEADAEFWAAVEGGDLVEFAARLNVDSAGLGDVLPVLADYRRRSHADAAVADWRYRVSWVPVTESSVALSGRWLVLGAGTDADAVRATLAERGAEVLRDTGQADIAGVVSVLPEGPAAIAELIRELGAAGVVAPLWVLTRGAVGTGVNDPVTAVDQAQVWGLGVVAALELGDRWGGLIDLPVVLDGRAGSRLVSVLAGGGEDQVAIRPSGIVGRRLVRASRPVAGRTWSPGGAVLVTGGTGGVGAITAEWVVGRGAGRVVLTSRSGPAAGGVAELAASLAAAGAVVDVVACDVAARPALTGLLEWIDASGIALSSVVHAASVGAQIPVDQVTASDLSHVLAAKARGAALLDELTADRELDAFILFSSGAGTWGSGGLSAYAAANAFLDALCDNRRSRGLVATSLVWGLWAGVGMAAGEGGDRLLDSGMEAIDAERGMRALGQAVDADEGVVVVAGFDWEHFVPTYTLRRSSPLLSALPEVRKVLAAEESVVSESGGSELALRLRGMSQGEQRQTLTEMVRAHAAAVLGYDSVDAVLPQRAFKDLGFDSVGAVALRNRLASAAGVRLPSTLVFDYPNAAALAEFIRDELVGTPGGDEGDTVSTALDRLALALESVDGGSDTRQDITERMQTMLSRWLSGGTPSESATPTEVGRETVADQLVNASADEVLDFINKELGGA
ncbi:SDR family NAD(P)-dependent oxidoreductase, partial [Actinoplanes sp. G11-F43]|uniref:SDR family NAD(P)-dependent oxidoreductase n=1 Tax=Actinoplanes sp. G11-F43 TaxID=3424130 RepID=UPI003D340CCC